MHTMARDDRILRMKQTMYFHKILNETNVQILDSSNLMQHKPWERALEMEVRGLDLDPEEWLQLLQQRTRGIAET